MMTLVRTRFLGRSCSVDRAFAAVLARVEEALRAEHGRDAAGTPFDAWHGVRSVGGYRARAGYHGRGLAIDVDYTTNPYIAVRTGKVFGGEAAGARLGVRRAAVEACDRACGGPGSADLSARRKGEPSAVVFDRFERVSAALRSYFAPYFRDESRLVARRPVPTYAAAPLEAFFPLVESGELFVPVHEVPLQVLRDYEAVRIPMVVGAPSASPGVTRNPARGFMDLRRPVVLALCDVGGLRWGMSDFGAAASGDGMHFDTARRIHA